MDNLQGQEMLCPISTMSVSSNNGSILGRSRDKRDESANILIEKEKNILERPGPLNLTRSKPVKSCWS